DEMHHRIRPRFGKMIGHLLGVELARNCCLRFSVHRELAKNPDHHVLFMLGAGTEQHPVSLQMLALTSFKSAPRGPVLVNQLSSEPVTNRPTWPKPQAGYATCSRMNLDREFSAELG